MKVTIGDLDVFELSGPTHLAQAPGRTWSNADYKRAALACLVSAVYAMEKDRTLQKLGRPPLAPAWCTPFMYKRVKLIVEEGGEQIVGAVFRWSRRLSWLRWASAPKVVVAFRGTIPELRSDLAADLCLTMQQLHKTSRFKAALAEIKQAILAHGVKKVCIAGHSLGAALCLLAGRTLALEQGIFVDAHLFNPPFPSLALENAMLQRVHMAAAARLAAIVQDETTRSEIRSSFLALQKWRPHLYVNVHDPICSSYVGYFSGRHYLLASGNSDLVMLAAPLSLRALLQSVFGEAKPYHLIPSAHLHVVKRSPRAFAKTHGMQQWWSGEYEIEDLEESLDVKDYAERVASNPATAG